MRWSAPLLIASLLVVGSAGCRSCQRVESELRTREDQLRDAQEHLACLQRENCALRNEVRLSRGEVSQPDDQPPPTLTYPIHELTLGRQTGGYEPDGKGGDTALQVVFEPRDVDNHVVKAPGTAEVEVYELPREGPRRLLSKWTISSEQLRKTWRASLLSTGYFVILPWQTPPATPKLYLIARFITPDGHVFEAGAGKEITVKLLSGGVRPTPGPVESHEPPPVGPTLLPQPSPEGGQSRGNQPTTSSASARWWVVPGNQTTSASSPLGTTPPPTPVNSRPQPPPLADTLPRYLPLEVEPVKTSTSVKPAGAWDPGW
jgi:hypothetical protein